MFPTDMLPGTLVLDFNMSIRMDSVSPLPQKLLVERTETKMPLVGLPFGNPTDLVLVDL